MRARTKRLKSLLVGIVSVLWSGHGSHAPRQRRPAATQRLTRCRSGSPPPFASRGPPLGEGRRGWAWITARASMMKRLGEAGKTLTFPLQPSLLLRRPTRRPQPETTGVSRALVVLSTALVIAAAPAVPAAAQNVHPTPPPETRAVPLEG